MSASAAAELEGARFRTKQDARFPTLTGGLHRQTWGFEVDVPAGTVVVVAHAAEGATMFGCVPENDRVGQALIPAEVRSENPGWSGHYHLVIRYVDLADLLEPAA